MKELITTTALLLLVISIIAQSPMIKKSNHPTVISQPVIIEDDDWKFEGTENMILLKENRNNPDSRLIPVHFFKFPAQQKSKLSPVVFLCAGPGEPYSVDVFYKGKRAEAWRHELQFVNQNRDVILINQRGNSNAPGLQISNFKYRWSNGGSLDQAFNAKKWADNRRTAYAKYVEDYQEQGVDLKGYDILHFVEDIEVIRQYLKADKIALIGNSFGSQWGLGYIQSYPEHVDRALFSGVEPLDHNYDDPDGIWTVLEKINQYAQANPQIANQLPSIGLIEAFKIIIERLEKSPQTAIIKDEDGKEIKIVIGADDLRMMYTNPASRSYLDEIESWPKYISEMYHGDFSFLAKHVQGRIYNSSSLMINPLVNNSIGISKQREEQLNKSASKRWLGNINSHYTSTRDICPAPKVAPSFREHVKHDIPILLIQGDMDLSTPYENALFLMDYLKNGHLITVKRGFHNAKRAFLFKDLPLFDQVYSFMNQDFEKNNFIDFKKTLPSIIEMPEFNFWPIDGQSLYENAK
jgi:pimeloyl-ACP methyl ester carboxylesterase